MLFAFFIRGWLPFIPLTNYFDVLDEESFLSDLIFVNL